MITYPDSDVLALKFEKHKIESERTRLFRDMEAGRQKFLLARVEPAADEVPVISYFADEAAWCLITDRRLVWGQGQRVEALDLADLVAVESELSERPSGWKKALDKMSRNRKAIARQLRVSGIDGRTAELLLEPGAPYYAMWNVLLWLCTRANSQRSKGHKDGQ